MEGLIQVAPGMTLIDTQVLEKLINKLDSLEQAVTTTIKDLKSTTTPYLSTKQVCEMLNVSENWVLLHKDDLGSSKRTGKLTFKRKAIEEFIEEDYFRISRRARS